ncbi:FMN-dependent oxidoreductase, nitrilotriacetate monooxygenase family [Arboricoccus pini]|uniref:FMN-dependent oxidoreductase, nitrilotriacetate monooxygenase family n=1 Tax=Arboricoccus pini TaxID=1963835 RepID=A0A212RP87_9PROT|nr:NtaA/DmoA family FMN-dependent monooxygenase [Arboricoccus pini]SNB74246.1 FMN-dependent oxidoreductase, nitrilotriacetate monooxygenase family [Arboricoccus pini]
MTRQIHVCLLDMPTVSHNNYGLWAHPSNRHADYKSLEFWLDVARLLERGLFDGLFFADVLGIAEGFGGGPQTALREGAHVPSHDPLLLISAMASVTRHLAFAATVSTTYEPPFALARRMSTLDHLTKGRIGWNVVTSYLPTAAANFGFAAEMEHDARYERAEEYMEVCYKLWESSWADDAVLADRAGQIYTDPAKVRPIDHSGPFFSVRGPHLAEPSPQRTPVIFQAGSSGRGAAFAARHAEGVFVGGYTYDGLASFVAELRAKAAVAGRHPRQLKTFVHAHVLTAPSDALAKAKLADFNRWSRAEGYIAHRFGAGLDLARHPPERRLEDIIAEGGPGSAHMARYPHRADATVGDIIQEIGQLESKRFFVAGTPVEVADTLEAWCERYDLDGFLLAQHTTPGTAADFIDLIVPELQKRGRYRRAYAPDETFRERLLGKGQTGLPRGHPGHAWRQHRPI